MQRLMDSIHNRLKEVQLDAKDELLPQFHRRINYRMKDTGTTRLGGVPHKISLDLTPKLTNNLSPYGLPLSFLFLSKKFCFNDIFLCNCLFLYNSLVHSSRNLIFTCERHRWSWNKTQTLFVLLVNFFLFSRNHEFAYRKSMT